MKYTQEKVGRVFVIRLEDGDKLPRAIEAFTRENNVSCIVCCFSIKFMVLRLFRGLK